MIFRGRRWRRGRDRGRLTHRWRGNWLVDRRPAGIAELVAGWDDLTAGGAYPLCRERCTTFGAEIFSDRRYFAAAGAGLTGGTIVFVGHTFTTYDFLDEECKLSG